MKIKKKNHFLRLVEAMIVVPVETRSRDMKPSGMADLPGGRLTDLTAEVIDSRLNVLTDHPPLTSCWLPIDRRPLHHPEKTSR